MKTEEFLQTLLDHKEKSLLFEYAPNLLVGANYHITEVKHVTIDAVDCGAGVDAWKETVIQLWEDPNELGKTTFMNASKATEILSRVGSIKPYIMEAEVKIEYSNANFHTAQLFVNDFEIRNGNLLIKLASQATDCKAKETCGVGVTAVNTNDQFQSSLKEAEGCAPGSGCC